MNKMCGPTVIATALGADVSVPSGARTRTRHKHHPEMGAAAWRKLLLLALLAPLGAVMGAGYGEPGSVLKAPFDIQGLYYPSGFMGDYDKIKISEGYREEPSPGDPNNLCTRFEYTPGDPSGSKGWAGVYWQRPASNWGESPGTEIQGASKLSFFARGENGGELVEFKMGGIRHWGDKKFPYSDSVEASLGLVSLTKEWKRYEIGLSDKDLTSVIGALLWSASASANPSGVVFYIDQIRFE